MGKKFLMSSAQKRMFIINQILENDSTVYNMPFFYKAIGRIDKERFENAINKVISRYEILRTNFLIYKDQYVQLVHDTGNFKLEYKVMSKSSVEDECYEFIRHFSLEEDSLIRSRIVEISKDEYILMFDIHHIIFDAGSLSVLFKEIEMAYKDENLQPVDLQYRQYAQWQSELDISKQAEYWKHEFEEGIPLLDLKTDYSRPQKQSFNGANIVVVIENETKNRVKAFAKENRVTEFMLMLSAFMLTLKKYTRQEEIVVGTPISGRTHADTHNMLGMFVNTLALKGEVRSNESFNALVNEIKEKCLKAYDNQEYQFEDLVESVKLERDMSRNPIFDVMFLMQNNQASEMKLADISLEIINVVSNIAKFDITLTVVETNEGYAANFEYCTDLFKQDTIELMAKHYVTLLENALKNPEKKLDEISVIDEAEEEKVIKEFNDTEAGYPKDKTVVELFEEQVALTPDNVAVVFEDRQLTYAELNAKANSLARKLRKEYDIKPDDFVAIITERSLEMVIGIYAIIKAGGAYVPIDQSYPKDRKEYTINDCNPKVILLGMKEKDFETDIPTLNLFDEGSYTESNENLEIVNKPNDLLYLIYTSGTTGKPKGVMIENVNLVRLINNDKFQFDFNEKDVWTLFHSYCFDFSVWEVFGSTLYGGKLVVVPEETTKDAFAFSELLEKEKVTVLNQVPSSFYNLINVTENRTISSVRYVIFGGEALSPNKLKQWHENNLQCKIVNMYGITETTVHVTYREIDSKAIENGISDIGSAIPTLSVYIMNGNELCGIGVPGELCVAGDGVARGYLGRPELTAEKFVKNPYGEGRMYRSGDLVRWLADGNIEYLGRIDEQVKIRGFRIELGEIESRMHEIEGIKEAVVLAREDKGGDKYLCAYVVSQKEIDSNEIKDELRKNLTDYMIPAYIIQIEEIPVTRNGKLDRKALPEPGYQNKNEYVAARNTIEEKIVKAFEAVLGVERVSVKDSFFDLGGDSIKAMRVVSKVREEGYSTSIKVIMGAKTPENIAKETKKDLTAIKAEQGEVSGEAGLTAIQKDFFESKLYNPNHFNQSFMYESAEKIDKPVLNKVLSKIVEHHDILRVAVKDSRQIIGKVSEKQWYDLSEYECSIEEINGLANELQRSIDIENGPLMKAGLFRTVEKDYVLLIIHHLAVDGVSWRIIGEDLENGYKQAKQGKEIRLPEKTTSFKKWSEEIVKYRSGYKLEKEVKYWDKVNKEITKGKVAKDGAGRESKQNVAGMMLEKQYTEALLKNSSKAYNTEINDLLLTALARAVNKVTGQNTLAVEMEGHGREEISDGINIERTVGWFTSVYPVVFENIGNEIGQDIRNTKETLHRIPNKGIGYGILKNIGESAFERNAEPDITFNYLGEFGAEQNNGNIVFELSNIAHGSDSDPENKFGTPISINGAVQNGILSMGISYDESEYKTETVEKLCEEFKHELVAVTEHCQNVEAEYTASDFGENEWTDNEFKAAKAKIESKGEEIERIYPLTAMQEGMLFEKLANEESTQYIVQQVMKFNKLNIENIHTAFEAVVDKHDILHTVIKHKEVSISRQVLLKERKPEFKYVEVNNEEEYREIKANDVKRGFDLEDDTLIRMIIVKVSHEDYRMILTNHHIIADGWCISIIYGDLFRYYKLLESENEIPEENAGNFEEFVRCIEEKDKEESLKYWENLLEAYEEQADILPMGAIDITDEECIKRDISLSKEVTEKAERLSAKYGVTINTLVEAVWGVLLQKYNRTDDVVFGKVVSGRNAEVKNIEQMIGLFINTIPVRVKTEKNDTFETLISKLQEQAIASNEHDYCPLAEIQNRSSLGNGLVGTIMAFENYYVQDIEIAVEESNQGINVELESVREQISYDLGLSAYINESLNLSIMYNTEKYGKDEIELLLNHIQTLIENAIESPETEIEKLQMINSAEEEKVVKEFNDTEVEYPREKTVVEMFEEQAALTPDNVAAVFEDKQLTYAELNSKANSLARKLRKEYAIKADDFVAIITERSLEMIIGIYAIIKAGGAYVPIDPTYPKDRIEFMLSDCKPKVILKGTGEFELETSIPTADLCNESSYAENTENPEHINKATDLIYMIYTSGTTGKPKGVMVENKGINNLMNLFKKDLNIDSTHTVGMFHNYIFDGSVWEIMMGLLTGSKLVILTEKQTHDLTELKGVIESEKIDIIALPPQYAVQTNFSGVKILITAGSEAARELLENIENKYVNSYGPTENTISATYWEYQKGHPLPTRIPIGKPAPNVSIYILNGSELCGIGVPGELCIAGDGVARGYLGRPELTAEKFVKNPYGEGRMYRSGDLACWLPDGNIEYLGRIDEQVKIRGFRVELGEIESRMHEIEGIKEAVVIAREEKGGDKYLCAYVVSQEEIDSNEIKRELRKTLPDYMIPAYIMQIEAIPVTRSGKLDRKALPEPEYQNQNEYVAPRNEIEREIVETIEYVLGEEHIGMHDDFFDLGGHSILLIELINILKEKFKVNFSISDFIDSLTPEDVYKKYQELIAQPNNDLIDWENIQEDTL